ncbi:MAG: DUF2878 domain-containing protein [Gammaproteobacteria bacterium]|jgi:hypothetical protein|nr:DUF2878 domain-containing protein [Gammaproteobacteria bacterium]
MSQTIRKAMNLIVYQAGWLIGVIAAARGQALPGTLVVAAAIALHVWLAPQRAAEIRLIGAALLLGLAWESLLVSLGLFHYVSGTLVAGLAPYWIVALWGQFATTLNLSLAWLKGRPFVAAVFGALGAPLAYYAGIRLGALDSPDLPLALALQGIGYAVFTPLLCGLAGRWNGFAGEAAVIAVAARTPTLAPVGAVVATGAESRRA